MRSALHLSEHELTPSYRELIASLRRAIGTETDALANLANAAAVIYRQLPDLNWCGFYLLRKNELVLGPFQGLEAVARISMGSGVCGVCAEQRKTILVDDVNAFPGHIACDIRSRSEIVTPLIKDSQLLGVLDIDSPQLTRFTSDDAAGLEFLIEEFCAATDFTNTKIL